MQRAKLGHILTFLNQALEKILDSYNIDHNRYFLTFYSNGVKYK